MIWAYWHRLMRRLGNQRHRRLYAILEAEMHFEVLRDQWAELARVTEDPEMLYTANYRRAAAEQMRALAEQAWAAEYRRKPEISYALRQKIKAIHARTTSHFDRVQTMGELT